MTWEQMRLTLLKRRLEIGWIQDQLAAALHVSRGSIQAWETGRRTPSAVVLIEWTEALGLKLGFALAGREKVTVDA